MSGDIVNNETTPVLAQGALDHWIDQLRWFQDRMSKVRTIYPGHGRPGPAAPMVNAQIEYLTSFRQLVSDELSRSGTITREGTDRIAAATEARFPRHWTAAGFESRRDLIRQNVLWVARSWQVKEVQASWPGVLEQ